MSADNIVQAVYACRDPACPADRRRAAIQVIQQASQEDPLISCAAFAQLISPAQPPDVQLSGLALMQQVVRKRWGSLSEQQQSEAADQVVALAWREEFLAGGSWPLRSKLSALVSDLIIRRGTAFAQLTLQRTLELVERGPHAAQVAFLILQYVSEEVNEGELGALTGNKRDLLATVVAAAPAALSQIFRGASEYVQRGVAAAAAGDAAAAAACKAAVAAALDVVTSLVAWLPLPVLHASQLMDACGFLVTADEFKAKVVEICHQMCTRHRKPNPDDQPHYRSLYQTLARLLCHAASRVLPANGAQRLELADDDADLACRLCDSFAAFVVGGHALVAEAAERQALLQHLLAFLSHDYLPLVAVVLPAWAHLVQEQSRAVSGKPGASMQPDSLVILPDDCVRAVMEGCVRHVAVVVSPTDKEEELPAYMDSTQDWKEFCSAVKSRLKYVLIEAARLAHAAALGIASTLVHSVPRGAGDTEAALAAETSSLEVVCFVLESVVPSMCASEGSAAVVDGLEGLLDSLLQLQTRHPPSIALLGRCMEAFGAVVELDNRVARPATDAFFGLLERMHALRGGRAAGNDDTAPFVREQRQLTKAFLALAAKAPAAFVPLLEGVFQRATQLQAAGAIGDADRNQILEGILASSASTGAARFAQVVSWLVAPVKDYWQREAARLESEDVFLNAYFTPLTVNGGELHVGRWDERTRVYYTLQLLMICARQSKHVAGGGGGQALEPHLEWMLLPALRLQRCTLGLARPGVLSGPWQPLAPALEISPLEKAACIGQQAYQDAKSRTHELEPGRMDGTSVHAVRGWIRQTKELAMMLVTECAAECAAFWRSPTLCREVAAANLYSLHVQEPRSMRLVIHHALVPLMRACPASAATDWMLPQLSALMPLLSRSVTATWTDLMLKLTGAVGGAKSKQTEGEIIQEVLLRELSRDVVELLRALVGSTSFPAVPADRMAAVFGRAPGAPRRAGGGDDAARGRKGGGARDLRASDSFGSSSGHGLGGLGRGDKGPALNSIAWDDTVAAALLPGSPAVVASAIELATQAMSWPDQQTCVRAVAVCRTVAAAAGAPLNPVMTAPSSAPAPAAALRPLLVGTLLPAALQALARSSAPQCDSELLLLIRSIYVSCALDSPSPTAVLQSTLPGVTPQHLQQLNADLEATKGEKPQKDAFKRLFTAVGFTHLEKKPSGAGGVGQTGVSLKQKPSDNVHDSPPVALADLFS